VESTQATIPSIEIGLRQASNRLCTLLGVPPRDLAEILGEGNIPSAPPEVAVGIPADLLRRRPDIRAAERAVAAQSEQIGIALADLYPHFSINGEFALEAEDFGQLFASPSSAGSIGPSLRWDLLNYGRIINNVRLQQSGLQELIANYRNTVLTANQEVEDALVAFLRNQQRVRYLEAAVKETQETLRLVTISFEEGDIDFTGIFVLQGVLAPQQDRLAQARGDVAASLIGLYKALGGGWEIRCPGFQPRGVVSESEEKVEVLPTPEPMPSLPAPSGEPPPAPREPTQPDPGA
jgi:NodT family efflux transporter outer membrane factor (OMF) lipoprotein